MTNRTCKLCDYPLPQRVGRGAPLLYCPSHRAQVRAAVPKDSLTLLCTIDGCTRPLRARGWCNAHYKQWSRVEGRTAPSTWDDRRRDNYHARRARMNGARNGDRVMIAALIERDGTSCSWCGDDIDLGLAWPNPMSKSIDHVRPVSKGGQHTMQNTRVLHLACNTSKGDKLDPLSVTSSTQ